MQNIRKDDLSYRLPNGISNSNLQLYTCLHVINGNYSMNVISFTTKNSYKIAVHT